MRIHAIRVQNINSLTASPDAPQVLDLDGDLGDAPIFLIRGPTGAGKSTLLDAVTLALFGQTARLTRPVATRAAGDGDVHEADPRNALSHGEGAGFAEVEFSVLRANERRRYCARWSVRRARDKASGALQAPMRSLWQVLADGTLGESIVESEKAKDYQAAFEEVLGGLTFDDFVRSVLLAQGEFQAFLKASAEQRSTLLARLTDASRFRAIGMAAAQRVQAARGEVKELQARLDVVRGLGPEARAALEAEAAEASEAAAEATESRRAASARLEARRQLDLATARRDEAVARSEAAASAVEGAASDSQRLEAHHRATPFEGDLVRLDALLESAARHAARIEALDREGPGLDAAVVAASDAIQAAEAQEARAREEALALRPRVAAAREAVQKEDAAVAESAQVAEEAARARRAEEAAALALREVETGLGRVREKLRALSEGLAKVNEPERYGERAAEAERALREAHRQRDEHRAAARKAHERQAAETNVAELNARAESESARLEAAAAAAETASAAAKDAVARIGDAGDVPSAMAALRSAVAAAGDALKRAEELERVVLGWRHAARELVEAEGLAAVARETAEREATALGAARERARGAGERIEALRAEREIAARYGEIARQRGLLQAGEACPLCGSEGHPFLEHPERAPSDDMHRRVVEGLEAELKALEAERVELARQADAAERRDRETASTRAAAEATLATRHSAVTALRSQAESLAGLAELETLDPSAAVLAARRAASEAAARQEAFEGAAQTWRQAEVAAQKAVAERDRARDAVAAARHRVDEARHARVEADETLTARQAVLDASLGELAAVLRGLAMVLPEDPTAEELERCVERVQKRAHGIAEALAQRAAAEREELQLAERAGALATSLQEKRMLHEAVAVRAQEAERRRVAAAEAVARALEALGGKAPDLAEREADARAEAAREGVLLAQRRLAVAREAVLAHRTQRATAETERAGAAADTEALEARLSPALEAAGWGDRHAARAALLGASEKKGLEAALGALREAETAARAAVEAARKALEGAEAEASRAGLELASLPSASTLAEALAAAEAAVGSANAAHGAAMEKLRADDAQRDARQRLSEAATAAEMELARWEAIHKVIGRHDGEAFVHLAQAFHLEELAARANARLAEFSRRYTLAVRREEDGTPTLDFVIVDTEQAGRQRPPSTLSGGETFIISLALALALADFRTADMPIETVLIDEGFGTLDPETLATIIATLESLHASTGSRIGLISHVGMLAESIPARVFVRPVGQGRSVLELEGR